MFLIVLVPRCCCPFFVNQSINQSTAIERERERERDCDVVIECRFDDIRINKSKSNNANPIVFVLYGSSGVGVDVDVGGWVGGSPPWSWEQKRGEKNSPQSKFLLFH